MKILIVPYGWMGDTLFATSMVKVLKDKYPISSIDFLLIHPSMIDVISLIPGIGNVVYSSEGYDFVFVMPHTNVFENPLKTYASSIDNNIDSVIFNTIPYTLSPSPTYITYQVDWQNRTKLNIPFIIDKLSKRIECIPVGKNTSISVGGVENNKLILNQNVEILSKSKLHLGMLGGMNVLSSYLGIPTFTTLDNHFHSFHQNLTSDEFYKKIQIIPSVWCNDKKHHEFHPDVSEEELIEILLSKI